MNGIPQGISYAPAPWFDFSLLEGTVPFALHGMAVMHFLSIIATGVTLMDESACPFVKLVTAKL